MSIDDIHTFMKEAQDELMTTAFDKYGFIPLTSNFVSILQYVTEEDTQIMLLVNTLKNGLYAIDENNERFCIMMYMIHFCHSSYVCKKEKLLEGTDWDRSDYIDQCPTWLRELYKACETPERLFTKLEYKTKKIVNRSSEAFVNNITMYARGNPEALRIVRNLAYACNASRGANFRELYYNVIISEPIEPIELCDLFTVKCNGDMAKFIHELRLIRLKSVDETCFNVPVKYAHDIAMLVNTNRGWWKQSIVDELKAKKVRRIPRGAELELAQGREENNRFCRMWAWITHNFCAHSINPETGTPLMLYHTKDLCARRGFACAFIATFDQEVTNKVDDMILKIDIPKGEQPTKTVDLMAQTQKIIAALRWINYKAWLQQNALHVTNDVLEAAEKHFLCDVIRERFNIQDLERIGVNIKDDLDKNNPDKQAQKHEELTNYLIARSRIIGSFFLGHDDLETIVPPGTYDRYHDILINYQKELLSHIDSLSNQTNLDAKTRFSDPTQNVNSGQ